MTGVVRRLRGLAGRLSLELPDPILERLPARPLGYGPGGRPDAVVAPDGTVRLLLGPVNSAGQADAWARAAESIPGVSAVSMQRTTAGGLSFPADQSVDGGAFGRSHRWGAAQFRAVADGFSHVGFESARALFGRRFGFDAAREAAVLRGRGIAVASFCHGSDIRIPSRHREQEAASPFGDPGDELTETLERSTVANHRTIDAIGGPVFVSTPDLLRFRPDAEWLPVVVRPQWFAEPGPVLERPTPVVVHAPSRARMKGTELIDGVMQRLDREGVIRYERLEHVPADRMPEVYRRADIVLDQFSLGSYGVAACEAMAAGRLVVSHVSEEVRRTTRRSTGSELPIVEADAESIEEVVRAIAEHPEAYVPLAADGRRYAEDVHDGRRSAAVLRGFLGGGPVETSVGQSAHPSDEE